MPSLNPAFDILKPHMNNSAFSILLGLFAFLACPGGYCEEFSHVPEWQVERVEPSLLAAPELAGAWRRNAVGDTRVDISLNGFWKFVLCREERETPPAFSESQWGYFLVPGFWRSGPRCNYMRTADGRAVEKVNGMDYDQFRQAWYSRDFITPPEAAGAQVLLRFDALYSRGRVILNGHVLPLPEHAPVSGRSPACWVDVTGALRPAGENNTLFVATAPDGEGDLTRAGLQDNVWFSIRPRLNFGQMRVSTFVQDKKLRVDFGYGTLPADFAGEVEFSITDAKDGTVVHRVRRPYAPTVQLDYITPKLWSVDSPNLYYLHCVLRQGGRQIDQARVRFGFRELTMANGRFLLNGEPLMINSDSSWQGMWAPLWYTMEPVTRQCMRMMKLFGINSVYSQRMNAASLYDIADEEGFLCVERCELSYDEYNNNTPEKCVALWRTVAEENRRSGRLDNHPSVVAILINVYFQMSASANNPAYIGMSRFAASYTAKNPDGSERTVQGGDPNFAGDPVRRAEKMEAVAAEVREYFPDAEVLTGASGHVRNAYGVHIYHTWGAPWAELCALFSRYSKERAVPVYCGEYAVPYHGSYAHLNLWGTIRNRPEYYYWAENAARVLGPSAYSELSVKTTFAWDGAFNDLLSATRGNDGTDPGVEYSFLSDLYARTLNKSVERTVFFWRYDGLAGLAPFEYFSGRFLTAARNFPKPQKLGGDMSRPGVKPAVLWGSHILPLFPVYDPEAGFRPNTVSTPFRNAMAKRTCRLVGSADDIYADDHAYWGGEDIGRAVGVINMSAEWLAGTAEITLLDESNYAVSSASVPVEVQPFGEVTVPFTLGTPQVSSRREFLLRVRVIPEAKGQAVLTASREIQLFPRMAPLAGRPVRLFGGNPAFAAALKEQGYSPETVESLRGLEPDGRVLIVAPGALDSADYVPDFSALAEKGVNVLIMEQYRKSSSELIRTRTREAYVNAPAHPVLEGLADADFAEWRGGHSLDPAYGVAEPGHVWSNANWTDWGNRGMVAGNVFRRPYAGNFLSLLVCGFDLYQTPLLEYRGRRGVWLGSQLEIGSRLGGDPVATLLFRRMVDYLETSRRPYGETAFFGGDRGRSLLAQFGAEYREVTLEEELSGFPLLIVSDPDWKVMEKHALKLSDYVYDGGRILYLHTGGKWFGSWLPFLLEMKQEEGHDKALLPAGTAAAGNWREGWGNSELYWRGKPSLPVFGHYPVLSTATSPAVLLQTVHGRGKYLFCAVTPQSFNGDTMAAAKTARLVSALLTANGVALRDSASPYKLDRSLRIPLRTMRWEFALDPHNAGLAEGWQEGRDGSGKWLSGQQTLGGEFVRPGTGYESFLERDYAGVSFYRLRLKLTAEQAALPDMRIELGHVNTSDTCYVNGVKVGSGNCDRRVYPIPGGVLREGENVIVVRIENQRAPGGLVDAEVYLGNDSGRQRFWKALVKGDARDYDYDPDWIRQY